MSPFLHKICVGTSVTSNPKSNFGSSVSSDPVSNLLDGISLEQILE